MSFFGSKLKQWPCSFQHSTELSLIGYNTRSNILKWCYIITSILKNYHRESKGKYLQIDKRDTVA